MNTCAKLVTALAVVLGGLVCAAASLEADDKAAGEGTLIVIDSGGKEQKLKAWKIVAGTRRLSWLVPADPDKDKNGDKKNGKNGPEALEFREENSTQFVDGILTLVPLDRIRAIEYDDKDGVAVRVATSDKPEADEVLKGTTKYKGINKLTIEAEVDKGDLGVAEIKYLGGVEKGIRGARFPSPKAAAAPAGRAAVVTVADQQKGSHKVVDLQPLYRFADRSERLVPTLMFKKTLKVDIAKVQKLRAAEGRDADGVPFGVTLKDGGEETFTLLKTVTFNDEQATLLGLLGRVPAGYKLFPLHTIAEVQFDDAKEEPKPEPKK